MLSLFMLCPWPKGALQSTMHLRVCVCTSKLFLNHANTVSCGVYTFFSASIRKLIGIQHVKLTFSNESYCLAQKYRAHAKEQIQKLSYKDVLAQASRVLGEAGMEMMLRKLGNVGLQAMLTAREMANGTSTAPDEQVRADFFAGSFLGL